MATLAKYRTMQIVISAADAHKILTLYFPFGVPQAMALDENDRRFAQAIIVEAAEATAKIGFIESLWKSASSPAVKPMGVIKTAAKAALRYLGRPKNVQDAVDLPKYEMVANVIAYNCKSVWAIRVQTGDSSLLL